MLPELMHAVLAFAEHDNPVFFRISHKDFVGIRENAPRLVQAVRNSP
jgi:hypothetical protein